MKLVDHETLISNGKEAIDYGDEDSLNGCHELSLITIDETFELLNFSDIQKSPRGSPNKVSTLIRRQKSKQSVPELLSKSKTFLRNTILTRRAT
jgi:hypothetical protein